MTRPAIRWHFTPRDVGVLLARAAIVVLDGVLARIVGWVDGQ